MGTHYFDLFLVSISKVGGTDYNYAGITETLRIPNGFEKDGSSVAMLDGSRRWKRDPSPDITIEFDMYPLDTGTIRDDGGIKGVGPFQIFEGATLSGSASANYTAGLTVTGSNTRDNFRVVIALVENSSAMTLAHGQSSTGYKVVRYAFADCKMIRCRPDPSDYYHKVSVAFKCPPLDENGSYNYALASVDPTVSSGGYLPPLNSYTSITKF